MPDPAALSGTWTFGSILKDPIEGASLNSEVAEHWGYVHCSKYEVTFDAATSTLFYRYSNYRGKHVFHTSIPAQLSDNYAQKVETYNKLTCDDFPESNSGLFNTIWTGSLKYERVNDPRRNILALTSIDGKTSYYSIFSKINNELMLPNLSDLAGSSPSTLENPYSRDISRFVKKTP